MSGTVNYADINVGDTPTRQRAVFFLRLSERAAAPTSPPTLTAEQLAAITGGRSAARRGAGPQRQEHRHGDLDLQHRRRRVRLPRRRRDADADLSWRGSTTITRRATRRRSCRSRSSITGTNDKPTLSATGGTITERIGTGNTAIDTVTGTVTFADVDLTDRPVVSAAISTTDPFRYLRCAGQRRHRDADAGATGGDPRRRGAAHRGAGGGQYP